MVWAAGPGWSTAAPDPLVGVTEPAERPVAASSIRPRGVAENSPDSHSGDRGFEPAEATRRPTGLSPSCSAPSSSGDWGAIPRRLSTYPDGGAGCTARRPAGDPRCRPSVRRASARARTSPCGEAHDGGSGRRPAPPRGGVAQWRSPGLSRRRVGVRSPPSPPALGGPPAGGLGPAGDRSPGSARRQPRNTTSASVRPRAASREAFPGNRKQNETRRAAGPATRLARSAVAHLVRAPS